MKKYVLFTALASLAFARPANLSAQTRFGGDIRQYSPEIGLGTYAAAAAGITVGALATDGYSNYRACLLSSHVILGGAAAANVIVDVRDSEGRAKWIPRALYIASVLPPALGGLFDPGAEGEDRAGLFLRCGLPALVGVAFTFIPPLRIEL